MQEEVTYSAGEPGQSGTTCQVFIAWLNYINFLFIFSLNCCIFFHEALYLLGCVGNCGYF